VDVKATDTTITKIVSDAAYSYPEEYAIAGWFKWDEITK
jgi:hypothetical protein